MNDKLKEILGVLACLGLLIGLGFYTGFFNQYNWDYAQNLINSAISEASSVKLGLNLNDDNKYNSNNKNTSRIGSYRANNIPSKVMEGVKLTGYWSDQFNPNKKVIFYVYDSYNNNFIFSLDYHKNIEKYFTDNELDRYYDLKPMDLGIFQNYYVGIIGSTKVCNSIEECNAMRNKATLRADMQMFLDKCAKTTCIINVSKNEFIFLRNRDSADTIKALNEIKNW